MVGASPDAVPGLEAYVVVLLSCIITRRRRAAAHRARLEPSPSIMKSHPWERGFTVEGRAANKLRGGREDFMQKRLRDLTGAQFLRRYKVRKSTFKDGCAAATCTRTPTQVRQIKFGFADDDRGAAVHDASYASGYVERHARHRVPPVFSILAFYHAPRRSPLTRRRPRTLHRRLLLGHHRHSV